MGSLSKDRISFNHDDIDRIEFIGYISGEHQNFNSFLLNFNSNDSNQLNTSTNSVLEIDNKIEIEEPKPIFITPIEYTSSDSNNYDNFDSYDNSINVNNVTNDNSNVDNKNIFDVYGEEINSNISDNIVVFDENGMINSNNLNDSIPTSSVNNDIISNNIGVMSPAIDYKFDENGIVIAEV